MAKKIETDADVLEWAKSVVDAEGEKFTALSKGEQYQIARYICDMNALRIAEANPPVTEKDCGNECSPSEEEVQKDEDLSHGLGEHETNRAVSPEQEKQRCSTATMTRGYAYHRAGYTAQQTFDKFLAWGKEHPTELSVMDFSTGRRSTDCAFAYWLNEIITVDVPTGI